MSEKVFWVTGLAGAGKTTIGKIIYNHIKTTTEGVVFLDGDLMRETIAHDLGYTKEDRLICAYRYARLCKLLSSQGLIVICCTISMFDEVRNWSRENIDNYIEIYIRVSQETLINRDQKNMYSTNQANVMGLTLSFEEPKNPDIIIDNNCNINANRIIDKIILQQNNN
ncbi:MAG: adenylyl-sulfate kinase [Epulopiscium sp. Nuni2H_MBin003]|nr:MAG: adenylyl-sulfate kinase [Epulopiscium sp. Nuni2H_MBin003]